MDKCSEISVQKGHRILWLEPDIMRSVQPLLLALLWGLGASRPLWACTATGTRGPGPPRSCDALPPARPPLTTPPGLQLVLPSQLKPCTNMSVSFAKRRNRHRLLHISGGGGGGARGAPAESPDPPARAASDSHAAPSAPRVRPGPGGPGLPAPSARSAPLRAPRRPAAAATASPAPPRAQGQARRGRGTAVTPPVPCLQESRVRRGHVVAPQPIAENAVREQGGCGERPTKTGDVFTPGPGRIRGCCSGDRDTGSGGRPEVLVQGVNPSAPVEPRVRAGQGGVATRGEEGGRGFESVPGTWEETLRPQLSAPSPPRSQVGGCASASRAQPPRAARPGPAQPAARPSGP